MLPERSTWSATFVGHDQLDDHFLYRRLHFKNLRNNKAEVVKSSFSIDESEQLQVIGYLSYGEIVGFVADDNFENISFQYPYGKAIDEHEDIAPKNRGKDL